MSGTFDSKAYLICILFKIPRLIVWAVVGGLLGCVLRFGYVYVENREPVYTQTLQYYIDFAQGRYEARDYYNAYTWNDVIKMDVIVDKALEVLGDAYSKDEICSMISVNMPSDVRYLKVIATSGDKARVEAVSEAYIYALDGFGLEYDEFDSISLIDKGVATLVEPEYFTARALLLGMVVALLIGLFVESVRFATGDRIYTRKYLEQCFGFPSFTENEVEEDCFRIDVCDKDCRDFETLDFEKIGQSKGALITIPFGEPARNRAEYCISELTSHGCQIKGVALTGIDERWFRLYYGGGKKS